jgi:uncharacterized protein
VVSEFDWDDGNKDKCQKHGVSLAEIEAVFQGRLHVFPDAAHSKAEIRYLGIGQTATCRYVFIAFTVRDHEAKRLIRPISARYMHAKEVKHYETQIANS